MRWILILMAGLTAALVVACNDDQDDPDVTATAGPGGSTYLYILDADSGTSEAGTVVLTGVKRYVLSFTDRPNRQVGHIPLEELAQKWDGGTFTDDPPNAAVSWDDNGEPASAAIEITGLSSDGDTVTLTYRELQGTGILGDTQAAALPNEFSDVNVVVDSAPGYVVMPFKICLIAPAGTPEECQAPSADILGALNVAGPYPQENVSGTFTNTTFSADSSSLGVIVHDDATEAMISMTFDCSDSDVYAAYEAIVSWIGSSFDASIYGGVPSGEPECYSSYGRTASVCDGTSAGKDVRNTVFCIWSWTGGVPTATPATPVPTATPDYSTMSSAQIIAEEPSPSQYHCVLTASVMYGSTGLLGEGLLDTPAPVCDRAQDVFQQAAIYVVSLFPGCTNCTVTENVTETPSAYDEQWPCTVNLNFAPEITGSIECTVPGTTQTAAVDLSEIS